MKVPLKDLKQIIEANTSPEFGTVDYDGVARDFIKYVNSAEERRYFRKLSKICKNSGYKLNYIRFNYIKEAK